MSTNIVSSTFEGAYWIKNKSNGSVLGIGATINGSTPSAGEDKLGTRQTLADRSQMWLVEPLPDGASFRIRNAQSGGMLDVQGSSAKDGVLVVVYPQTNNPNQHWTFEWVDDANGTAYYRINNNSSKKALNLTTGSSNIAVSSTWYDGQQQRWAFDPVVFPPVYWISHAQTGWYLQYDKANSSAIAADRISPTDASRSQLWFVESIGDNDAYIIRSVEDEKKVLDLSGGGTANGTPVIAYNFHGGKHQQWQITNLDASKPDEARVKIISALAKTVIQTWRLHQYPFPPVYWTTLQNLKTGTFLKDSSSTVSPSSGMTNALDFIVQWRFVQEQSQPHYYTIINRATGSALLAREQSPTVVPGNYSGDKGALWSVEPAGNGIAIVSTSTVGALDHDDGGTTIEAYPKNGTTNPYHHWIPVQVSDRLPSFALANSRTGHSLDFRSATKQGGVVMSTDSMREWSNQWYLDILSGEGSSTIYAIINKESGMVLDHWDGQRIEAQNDDTNDPHHQWRLVPCPCGENYFQIQNVSTDRYLEERVDNVPNANRTTPMNPDGPTGNDKAQCWELVFARVGDYDLVNIDDDILQRVLPYFQPLDSETLKHRIVKRAPSKEKKGKAKNAHIPQQPRLLRDVHKVVISIFSRLINQWDEGTLLTTVQAGTRVSTNAREVQNRYQIPIPQALRVGSERDGWIRIDIQGTYETSPGNRVAYIQGQWNNNSVFIVIVPLGVNIGVETIRGAMRQSLNEGISIAISLGNSRSPVGGSKPNTTPRPPPGPSGGSGNVWVSYAVAIMAIVLL